MPEIVFTQRGNKKIHDVNVTKLVLVFLILGLCITGFGLSVDNFIELNENPAVFDGDIRVKGNVLVGHDILTLSENRITTSAGNDFEIEPSGNIVLNGMNWPSEDGAANRVLSTNGDGNLSWVTNAGGGGATKLGELGDVISDIANFTDSLILSTDGSEPSLAALTTGSTDNIGIGNNIFENLTSGSKNVCIGNRDTSNKLTSGGNNIIIGYDASPSLSTVSNEITLGDSSVDTLRCGATTIASVSDRRDKTDIIESKYGLNFIEKLKPVQFTWNRRVLNKSDENYVHNGKKRIGFIAQDFQDAMKDDENNILDLVNESNPERIEAKYGNLIPILVKSIQELQNKITLLEKIIEK
tara:strand:+ start:19519 stop:20583 length:1065 start_codon:yes stop_codon:yes gene_type:complete